MANKNRNRTFHVIGKMLLEVSIPITAENLEAAVAKSKELKEADFVDFLGDFNDGSLKINGVFEEYKSIEL